MKLRDFGKKSKSSKPVQKFVLQNDALENKYKAQIDDLNTQLGHYRRIEAERDEAVAKKTAIEDILKSERLEFDKTKDIISDLEKIVEDQTQRLEQLPALQEEVRNAKGQANSRQVELDAMTKRAVQQSQDLGALKSKVETFQKENKNLVQKTSEALSLKQSMDVEFESISNKNKELESFSDETSKINKELVEENKTLRDWANYKDVENKGLINQLEELQSVETNLQELMSKMELKDSETTSSNTSLTTKVSTQQKVITDMGKTLEDMKKELVYLVRLNNEYKKELARPTYTSMAAIASQEGFVMPNGKENTRTHNLGNYKPTLLKFKKKEVKNGG
jgi:chromosome segregation ATPase